MGAVLVTGASRGIGAAIAERVAASGRPVVAAARSGAALEELCARLREEHGVPAVAVAMDVAEPASIEAGIEAARALLGDPGSIDGLVNNAGIAVSAPILPRGGEDLHELHMRINYHGARRVAEALLPGMIERGAGVVVNVASSAGLRGYPYVSAYCASKHALVGWTRSAALELEKRGVRVHAVCPHYVDSPMLAQSVERLVEKTKKSVEEARAFFASENPGGRLVTEREVADAVVGLLELEGTGVIAELDGSTAG